MKCTLFLSAANSKCEFCNNDGNCGRRVGSFRVVDGSGGWLSLSNSLSSNRGPQVRERDPPFHFLSQTPVSSFASTVATIVDFVYSPMSTTHPHHPAKLAVNFFVSTSFFRMSRAECVLSIIFHRYFLAVHVEHTNGRYERKWKGSGDSLTFLINMKNRHSNS